MNQTIPAASRRRRLLTLLAAAMLSAGTAATAISAGTAAACEHCGANCPSCQGVSMQQSSFACDCQSCSQCQDCTEPRRGMMLGLGSKLLDSVDRSADAFERSVHSLLDARPKLKRRSSAHHRVDPCDLPSYAAILEMPPAGQLIDEPFQHEFHCVDELGADGLSADEIEPDQFVAEHWDGEASHPEAIQPGDAGPVEWETTDEQSLPPADETNPFRDDPVHDAPVRTGTAPVSTRVRAAAPTRHVPTLHVPAVRPQTDYFHDPFGDEEERPVDDTVQSGNRYKSAAVTPASIAPRAANEQTDQGVQLRLGEPRPAARPVSAPVSNPVYSRAYDPQAYIEEQRRYDKVQDAVSKKLAQRRTLSNQSSEASDATDRVAPATEQVAPATYVSKPAAQDPLVRPAAALQLGR